MEHGALYARFNCLRPTELSTETAGILVGTEIPEGGRRKLYLMLHCHHQNVSASRWVAFESHFNVSLIVRGKTTR